MRILEKIRTLVAQDSVLVVSVIAALLSCIAVPPDALYATYFDWHTLVLLFCLMTVVTGLRFLGVIRMLGEGIVRRIHSRRMIAAVLIALTFCFSMFITNDVALITFVPFAIVVMHRAAMDWYMGPVVALMTIAANLGSMLLPMGNPQNLYLFQMSGMDVASFILLMAPYTLGSAILLLIAGVLVFRGRKTKDASLSNQDLSYTQHAPNKTSRIWLYGTMYAVLFVACLGAVINIINVYLVGIVVLVVVLIADRKTLLRIDYGLLFTFIALFVFVGNMARIPLIHDAISQLIGSAPVLSSVVLSQVISNVPTALLLSGFTDQWPALIVGTNIGGLGSLIASMASIISFKLITAEGLVKTGSYLRTFTLYNGAFLVVLLVLYLALSCSGIGA
ncbi:MAG: SLC13 family permease [Eggerthellaceae bacterium]